MSTLFLNIARLLGFAVLAPVVLAVTQAMNAEMTALKLFHHKAFLVGVSAFVFSYFFVYNFEAVHEYGRSIMEQICSLFGGRFENIAHVIPIYTILLLAFYYIFSAMGRMSISYGIITSFGIAFTFAMHIIHTAAHLYEADEVPFKPMYAFSMALAFVLNVCLLALLFDLVFPGFSVLDFLSDTARLSERYYRLLWSQLF